MSSPILFMTHHKCGSSWLSCFLDHLIKNNDLSIFRSHFGNATPNIDFDISLLRNAEYDALKNENLPAASFHIIRNPLAIVASAYFSHLMVHSTDGWERLVLQRDLLQNCGQEEGMYLTLAFLWSSEFYPKTKGPLRSLNDWDYNDERITTIRMEDLTGSPQETMLGLFAKADMPTLQLPASDELTFERFSRGRKIGEIDPSSHYRSGSPDQWRNDLPEGVISHVRNFCRSILQRFYPEALV